MDSIERLVEASRPYMSVRLLQAYELCCRNNPITRIKLNQEMKIHHGNRYLDTLEKHGLVRKEGDAYEVTGRTPESPVTWAERPKGPKKGGKKGRDRLLGEAISSVTEIEKLLNANIERLRIHSVRARAKELRELLERMRK